MLNKRFKYITLLFIVLGLSNLQAQESVNTTGGNASGNEGFVSYSIGQIVYGTYTGNEGSMIEGVQQPYEISVITDIKEINDIQLDVTIFPNPTADFLTLEIEDSDVSLLQFHIYDLNGKLLQKGDINKPQTTIDMSGYLPSTYFVTINKLHKTIKEFKVIKK